MKVNTNYTFRIIIEPDEKGTFHGYVPVLSGCHTFGATIEETRKNLKDAISVLVPPRGFDFLMENPAE